MSFWQFHGVPDGAVALRLGHDASSRTQLTYGELAALADALMGSLGARPAKRLGVVRCTHSPESIAAYLGALRCGDAVMLLGDQMAEPLWQAILDAHQPDWVHHAGHVELPAAYSACAGQPRLWRREPDPTAAPIHPDLAVLLSTSGTTGSPKMVRLSARNIDSNAESIVSYLGIEADDRAVTTLPFNYSYGMSVLNSHLRAGASLVLTDASLLTREFWSAFSLHQVTSLAGVPYTYQMLHRLDPRKLDLSSLRMLTQAGGHLAQRWVDYFRELSAERGWRFVVMYGQTEAAPRMSHVPFEQLALKSGSIGVAIPGGAFSLSDEGQLIYEGPNVMMGYALQRADLALGDELRGRLATGDLARIDEDGFVFLQGRMKRFVKVHGNRISLDDIEQRLEQVLQVPVAVAGSDERIRVHISAGGSLDVAKAEMTGTYRLHPSTFVLQSMDALPLLPTGKKDYGSLST